MTETALRNKDIAVKDKRERELSALDRANKVEVAKIQAKAAKDAAGIGAIGRFGSSMATLPFKALNDPSWYTKNPSGVKALNTMPIDVITNHAFTGATKSFPVSAALYFMDHFGPTFIKGMSTIAPNSRNAVNTASATLMTLLREWNSRIGEYQPSDLFQLLYAINELYRLLLWAGRAVRAAYTFDTFKPGIRTTLLYQMLFDAPDFISHLKDYEKFIQTEIQGLNTEFVLPADITLFTRKNFLAWNIYKEGEGDNSQFIFAQQQYYAQYDETASALKFYKLTAVTTDNPSGKMTYAGFVTLFTDLKSAILNYSKYVTFIADMRTAVRNGMTQFALGELDLHKADVHVVDEVLTQIMNANFPIILNGDRSVEPIQDFDEDDVQSWADTIPDVIQTQLGQDSAGFLEWQDSQGTQVIPTITNSTDVGVGSYSYPSDVQAAMNNWNNLPIPLNFYKNNVSVEEVMVATRFAPHYTYSLQLDSGSNYFSYAQVRYGGSEIPLTLGVAFTTASGSPHIFTTTCSELDRPVGVPIIGLLAGFNYRPTIKGPNYTTNYIGRSVSYSQQWDKVLEYSKDQSYWFDDLAIKSELYPAKSSINSQTRKR